MKKILLIFSLILLTQFGFGQIFKPVKIDSLVTVSLPPIYQKKDTLNQKIFTAQGLYGYMIVIKVKNPPDNTPLKKAKDLNKVFNDYMKGVLLQSGNGTILNKGDTTIGPLKAKVFTLQTDNGSNSLQLRKFIVLYTRGATYTFEYYYKSISAYLIQDEIHEFTSSIKISPELQLNDQYLATANTASMSPFVKTVIIIGIGVIAVIIIVVIIIRRKKRKKQVGG